MSLWVPATTIYVLWSIHTRRDMPRLNLLCMARSSNRRNRIISQLPKLQCTSTDRGPACLSIRAKCLQVCRCIGSMILPPNPTSLQSSCLSLRPNTPPTTKHTFTSTTVDGNANPSTLKKARTTRTPPRTANSDLQNLLETPQPPWLEPEWSINLFINLERNTRAFNTTTASVTQKQGAPAMSGVGTFPDKQHSPTLLIVIIVTKLTRNTISFYKLKKRTGRPLNPPRKQREKRLRQLPIKCLKLNPDILHRCPWRIIIPLLTPAHFVPPVRQGTQWRTLLQILTPPIILP